MITRKLIIPKNCTSITLHDYEVCERFIYLTNPVQIKDDRSLFRLILNALFKNKFEKIRFTIHEGLYLKNSDAIYFAERGYAWSTTPDVDIHPSNTLEEWNLARLDNTSRLYKKPRITFHHGANFESIYYEKYSYAEKRFEYIHTHIEENILYHYEEIVE